MAGGGMGDQSCASTAMDLNFYVSLGDVTCAKAKIDAEKIDVNALDSDGNAVIHDALDPGALFHVENSPKMVQMLIGEGADPNLANRGGQTPFELSLEDGADQVTALSDHGSSL